MRAAVLAVVLLLAGCATGPNWDAVHAERRQIQADCRAQKAKGALPDQAAVVRCATPRILALYSAHQWPYMDLLQFERAQLLVITEREDRGDISAAEADALWADVRVRVTSEMERRAAADEANRVAMFSAMQMMNAQSQPIRCTTFGTTTTCQ